MFFYIIPYLFVLFFTSVFYKIKSDAIPKGFFLFIILLPATLIALLRGDVGIDTLNYLGYFNDLRNGTSNNQTYEPGFNFLCEIINLIGLPARANIAIVSSLTIILLCISFSKTKDQVLLFSLVIFPLYFVDMTMNGLRYGLSFAFTSLGVQAIYNKKNIGAIVLSLVAISIQYSAALIIIPFLIYNLNKRIATYILIGIASFITIIIGYAPILTQYLYSKQDAYKDLASPSITSGLVPLLIFIIIYGSFIFLSTKNKYSKIIHFFLFLEVLSFGIAKISYAGLRLQTLFLFALLIFIKENFIVIRKRKLFIYVLFLVSLLSFLLFLKNISAQFYDVEAPMLPYKFFWQ